MQPLPPVNHHKPLEIAKDTHLIRSVFGEHGGPMLVYVNSLVIAGPEAVVVDTGVYSNREYWMEDVFSIVDPEDIRWVFLSHDDHDHVGNLEPLMEAAPNATLVTTWFMGERLSGDLNLPLHRSRWLNDGDTIDAGDRTLALVRPPLYDSPTTRGLFDPTTGVYWAVDSFATVMPAAGGVVENVADLDPGFWEEGFSLVNRMNSPWHSLVDPVKFGAEVARVERLEVTTIASGHSPVISGSNVSEALFKMRQMPFAEPAPLPGQAELEAIVAQMTAAPPAEPVEVPAA